MSNHLHRTKNKGFSIIEILIAFAIFACAVYPFINIMTYSSRANIKSVRAIQAVNLALSQLEQLKYGSASVEYSFMGANFKNVFSGFYALNWLITEASPGAVGTMWKEYTKSIPYGKIAGYPNYKIDISIAYFPLKTFPKKEFPPLVIDSKVPITTYATPKEQAEYDRLMSRIQVAVTVKWTEPDTKKELDFKAFTIVTKP